MTSFTINEGNSAGFAYWLRLWCRIVAALQIVGGLFGIYFIAFSGEFSGSLIIFLFALLLFATSVWSGVLLARGSKVGLTASFVVQAFQLVQVNVPGFLYSFCCGLVLVSGLGGSVGNPKINFNFFYGSRFVVLFNSALVQAPTAILTGLNLVALLCLVCLYYVRMADKKRPQIAQLATPRAEE